ncbi:MAG: BON domain-containing protein [Tangfeifania sp.]
MIPTNEELIKKGVVKQLNQDEVVRSKNIAVKVSGQKVILEGTVNSYSGKISASEAAARVLGVKDVENNLRVKYQQGVSEPVEEKIKVYGMISRLLKMSDS